MRIDGHGQPLVEGDLCLVDQLVVQAHVEAVVLALDAARGDARPDLVRRRQDRRQVDVRALRRAPVLAYHQLVRAPHHLVHRAEPEPRHDPAHLVRNVVEQVDHVLRRALELRPERRVLRRNPHRARVRVALAVVHAPQRNERQRRKSPLLRAKKARNRHIPPSLQLPVHLHSHAPAEVVQHKRLVRFRKAQLPGEPRMLDAREARSARAAVVARDENVVRLRLCDARRHNANSDLGHEFHRHARARVRALQVVDQLLQVLDRVDVVVRRRRDEAHAGRRVARARNRDAHLVSGQLPAFPGLRALRHLDLDLVRIAQVVRCHAEPARRHLRDCGAHRVARSAAPRPRNVLAALSSVRFPAQPVHRNRQSRVRLHRDRPVRHCARHKPPHDLRPRLHLV